MIAGERKRKKRRRDPKEDAEIDQKRKEKRGCISKDALSLDIGVPCALVWSVGTGRPEWEAACLAPLEGSH